MKKLVLGAALLAISAVSATAADLPSRTYAKAPPPLTAVYNWTGCYIGGNVGGGWHWIAQSITGRQDGTVFVPPVDLGSSNGGAFIGGGQIGCDYQFVGRWVVGVQGMFDAGNINSTNLEPDPRLASLGAPFQQTRTGGIYTGTARIGYLFAPQLLGYVKGGGVWTRTSTALYGTAPFLFLSESASANRSGWTVGGGLEYVFAPGWSVFGEYSYMDFGHATPTFVDGPGTIGSPSIIDTRLTMQTALIGVNYKLNWPGPVVAKY